MIENPMVLPEYEYKENYIPNDVWEERMDRDYDDYIFDQMINER